MLDTHACRAVNNVMNYYKRAHMIPCDSEFRALSTHQADLMKKIPIGKYICCLFTMVMNNKTKNTIDICEAILTIGEKERQV